LRHADSLFVTSFSKCFGSQSKRQLQKSPTPIGGEMNVGLSYFLAGVQTSAPVDTFSVQKTSAEIEELSLKTPRPVVMTE